MTTISPTNLRPPVQNHANVYLSVLQPASLLVAQVNDASAARGQRTVPYDTGSGSATGYGVIAAAVAAGVSDGIGTALMLEVDTAFGTEIVRVKSITGNEVSGELTLAENGISFANDQVIRIKHFYQPAPVPPAIRSGIFYKDYDIAFQTSFATQPNPVPIIGSHLAGFLSSGSIAFSLNSSSSYAIASGATISSRVWACVKNGGGASGISFSSTTAANPTLTITEAGQYWLSCQVTDSNGKTQTTYRFIAVHSTADQPYVDFTVDNLSADWDSAQWRCSLTLTGDLTLADIPDGSLAVVWYQNYFNNVEGYVNLWSPFGNNIVYTGYLWSDNDTDNWGLPDQGGGTGSASFEIISPLQYLDSITDYGTVSLEAATSPAKWSDYASWLTVGRGIHHILKWDTTLLEVCDVRNLTGNLYGVKVLEFTEDTALQRIQGAAWQRGVHLKLLCSRIGQLYLSTDSQMLNTANRALLDTVFSITANDISGGVNLVRNQEDVRAFADMDGFTYSHPTATPFISMIPGYIEATVSYNLPEFRGVGVSTFKQQVLNPAGGQTDCNERVGRLLAVENVDPREIRIDLRGNYLGAFDIVPREGWYEWTVANNALKRELSLNGILTVCRSVSHRFGYEGNRFTGVIQTSVVLQPEAVGPDGIPGNYPTEYPEIVTPAPATASTSGLGPNLIAYADADGGEIKARVITYSGSLSIGGEATVDASGGKYLTVVSLSATKAIVCYTRAGAVLGCVLNVSGTTITPGTPQTLTISTDAGNSDGKLDIDRISATTALLIYRNASGGVNGTVLSVSGTTITTGTAEILTAVDSNYVGAVALSSTVAIAFFIETGTDALDGCPIGISGATLTAGSPAAIEGVDNIRGQSAAKLTSGSAIVCYNNDTDGQVQGRVLSDITASAFTTNGVAVIDTEPAFDVYGQNKWVRAPAAAQGIVVWQGGGGTGLGHVYAAGLDVSGVTITPSGRVEIGAFEESYDEYATCALISSTRALVVYDESGIATIGAHARSFTFTGSTDPVADNNDVEFMNDTFNLIYEFTSTTLED